MQGAHRLRRLATFSIHSDGDDLDEHDGDDDLAALGVLPNPDDLLRRNKQSDERPFRSCELYGRETYGSLPAVMAVIQGTLFFEFLPLSVFSAALYPILWIESTSNDAVCILLKRVLSLHKSWAPFSLLPSIPFWMESRPNDAVCILF